MNLSARTWLIIGILYSIYIIYGTLLPFNLSLSFDVLKDSINHIEWTQHYRRQLYTLGNVDALINILLFIPLGIIIYNRLDALNGHRPFKYIIKTAIFGFLLSLAIELTQLFIKTRTTSLIDLIMNTMGCFLGAVIAFGFPVILSDVIRNKIIRWITKLPNIVLLIPIILVAIGLTEGIFLYFSGSDYVANHLFKWRYIIEPVWIWQVLYVYIPLGIYSIRVVRKHSAVDSLILRQVIAFGLAIIIAFSIAMTRCVFFNSTPRFIPIIFSLSGLLIGIVFYEILSPVANQINHISPRNRLVVLIVILAFFESLILYKFAYPFVFSTDRSYILDKFVFLFSSVYSLIPFSGFEKLLILSLQYIFLFIPIGIIVQEIEMRIQFKNKLYIILAILLILVILPILIQVFNKNQIAFLYELPINTMGLFLGYFLWFSFKQNHRSNQILL